MKSVALLAAAALAVAAAPAHAVLLNYTLTGARTATFGIDSNPVPVYSFAGSAFGVNTVGPSTGIPTGSQLAFFTRKADGGFSLSLASGYIFDGPQLFTGLVTAPTLRKGTFALTGSVDKQASTLSVTGPVPEPGVWAMLIAGFGLVGIGLRQRRASLIA